MNIKRSLSLTVLSIASLFSLKAQDSVQTQFPEDAKALQFQINGNFTLSSFQGAAISYKHHLRSSSALRIGVSAYGTDTNEESANDYYSGGSPNTSTEQLRDRTSISLQLNVQAIWYSPTSSEIFFFYGIGPLFGYGGSWQTNKSIYSSPFTESNTVSSKTTSWSVGLSGLAGVEWFPAETISIHAEYGARASFSWTSFENKYQPSGTGSWSESGGTTTTLNMQGTGVLVGLSVYF